MTSDASLLNTLDPHSPTFVDQRWEIYERLRNHHPVQHSTAYGGFWLVSRYEDVHRVLSDPGTFSSAAPGRLAIPPSGGNRSFPLAPLEVDPPRHGKLRELVLDRFRRPVVRELKPGVQVTADSLIDRFVAHGRCDVVDDYALPLVLYALARFLDLPLSDAAKWVEWSNIFAERAVSPDAAMEATVQLESYVRDLLEQRRQNPGDDLFSVLATAKVDGARLTDEEATGFGMELLLAGREATRDAIATSLWYLATHPDERDALRSDPASIPRAVEEFLRAMSPIQLLGRVTTRDVEIQGTMIPEGHVVGVLYGAANTDPEIFDEPEACVLARRRNHHLAFGTGVHVCVGAHLARLDITVAIERALERFGDFTLTEDEAPTFAPNGDTYGLNSLPIKLGRGAA